MSVYFIATNEHTGPFFESSYVHAHQEITFDVELQNEPSLAMRVKLPMETGLARDFLVKLAQSTLTQDYFEESYLGFDGGDSDYAYTFEEILEQYGLTAQFLVEGDSVVIRGVPK